MNVQFHPAVEQDVAKAFQRYDVVSQKLGEEFKAELQRTIALAANHPGRFHSIKSGFRRANLKRFPYHFLYREISGGIRVTLLRHHRRNPKFGMERQ